MRESRLTYIDITQVNLGRQNTETPSQGPRNIYKWISYNYPGLWAVATHRQQSVSFQDGYTHSLMKTYRCDKRKALVDFVLPAQGIPAFLSSDCGTHVTVVSPTGTLPGFSPNSETYSPFRKGE